MAYGLAITDFNSDLAIVGSPTGWDNYNDVHSPSWFNGIGGVSFSGSLSGFQITSTNELAGTWDLWIEATGNPDGFVVLSGSIPEPASLCLLGLVALPALALGRRRKNQLRATKKTEEV